MHVISIVRTIKAELILISDKWKRDVKDSQKEIKNLEKVGVASFAALGVAIALAAKNEMEFEQALKDVQAITTATNAEIKQLAATAKELAVAYGTSATEVVRGAGVMVRAGSPLADVMKTGAKSMVELASATEITNERAGEMLSVLGNVYPEMRNFAKGADLLAGAANAAAGGINDIRFGMANFSSVAKAAGLDAKEMLTMISMLTNAGLTGQDAGTSAKTFVQFSIPETEDAIRVAKEFGLVTAQNTNILFDQSGKMKDIAVVADILRQKFGHLNNESRTAIFTKIWGTDATRAALSLMDQGSEKIEALQREMSKTTAADVAATRMDTLKGSINRMTSELNVAVIQFSEAFNPVLRLAADGIAALTHHLNGMTRAQKDALISLMASAAVMGGTFLTAAVAARFAASAFGGTLIALSKNPVIFTAALLAAAITSIGVQSAQAEEQVRRLAKAQDELSEMISKNPFDNSTNDVEAMQQRINQIEEIQNRLASLSEEYERNNKAFKDIGFFDGAFNPSKTQKAVDAGVELEKQIANTKDELEALGVTAETADAAIAKLKSSIEQSIPAHLEMLEAERDQVASSQERINQMRALSDTVTRLSSDENLNADAKLELRNAAVELQKMFPALVVEIDKEGVAHVKNIEILGKAIDAEQALIKAKADALKESYEADRKMAESAVESAKIIIASRIAVAKSYSAAADSFEGDDFGVGDNQRKRIGGMANAYDAQTARIQQELNRKLVELAKIDNSLAMLGSGNFKDLSKPSGDQSWKGLYDPDYGKDPKKGKDEAAELERKQREAYEKDLAMERQRLERGVINHGQYAQALQSIQSKHSAFLAKEYDARFQLANEISKSSFEHSVRWIEREKTAMEDRGATVQQIAKMEADAWQRVADRDIYLADDRKRAVDELRRAKHDLASATYQTSVDWIEREKTAMERTGASEVEVAKMIYDAWGRVNSRRGTGVYLIEDERRATEELANATAALEKAIANDLRRAREYERDADLKAREDAFRAEERAIQRQIDALEEKSRSEDYITNLKKEQARLAELEADRAKIAADKRFELITVDRDGNLKAEMVADLRALENLDKNIRDQRTRIDDMIRDEERRKKRQALEEELALAREKYDREIAAARAYWDKMLTEERLTQDTKQAIVKNGLEASLKNVQTYLGAMVTEYKRAQDEIIKAGGLVTPGVGSIGAGGNKTETDKEAIKKQMAANGAAWHSATASERDRLHQENLRLGASIGARYDEQRGWIFHTGVDSVPGARGADVPATVQAGERIFSVSQNERIVEILEHFANWRPFSQPYDNAFRSIMRGDFAQTPMGGAGGGISVSVPIDQINVQSASPREIADSVGERVKDDVFRELERRLWRAKG